MSSVKFQWRFFILAQLNKAPWSAIGNKGPKNASQLGNGKIKVTSQVVDEHRISFRIAHNDHSRVDREHTSIASFRDG